jgi:uncharacterized protein YceH (UPF0502 family)
MPIELTLHEARIIGCLIEKSIATPDQYPLSLHALTQACNQKSNREPVMELTEAEVQASLDGLAKKHLVLEKSGFGSRVPKYQHRFCNTGFGSMELSPLATAILCELMLRGPQTPGELRSRAQRLTEIKDIAGVEATLETLAARQDGALVVRLAREPGRREARYAHLLCGADQAWTAAPVVGDGEVSPSHGQSESDRLSALEREVAELRRELTALKVRLGEG